MKQLSLVSFLLASFFYPITSVPVVMENTPLHLHDQIPSHLRAGNWVRWASTEYELMIKDKKMTHTTDGSWIAATPLKGDSQLVVWSKKKFDDHWRWFYSVVPLIRPPLYEAVNLRLPSSIWKAVNEDHAERRKQEREKIRNALLRNDGDVYDLCFERPIKSRITSDFASPRRLPNGYAYYHSGTDYRAATGTPVKATSKGEVMVSDDFIVPGKLVTLYHGGGVYSQYMHLSELRVRAGQTVERGEVIGLSGATGRVEAPHLHFEVYWKGSPANPDHLLEITEPLCDRG